MDFFKNFEFSLAKSFNPTNPTFLPYLSNRPAQTRWISTLPDPNRAVVSGSDRCLFAHLQWISQNFRNKFNDGAYIHFSVNLRKLLNIFQFLEKHWWVCYFCLLDSFYLTLPDSRSNSNKWSSITNSNNLIYLKLQLLIKNTKLLK